MEISNQPNLLRTQTYHEAHVPAPAFLSLSSFHFGAEAARLLVSALNVSTSAGLLCCQEGRRKESWCLPFMSNSVACAWLADAQSRDSAIICELGGRDLETWRPRSAQFIIQPILADSFCLLELKD